MIMKKKKIEFITACINKEKQLSKDKIEKAFRLIDIVWIK